MKKISLCLMIVLINGLLTACNDAANKDIAARTPPPGNEMKNEQIAPEIQNTPVSDSGAKKTDTSNPEKNSSSKDITAIIPKGWRMLEQIKGEPVKAEGDLNKDGIADIATVIEKTKTANDDEAPPRSLLIAFGNKDNTYTLSVIAENVVLKADEGGVWGDPFESLTIDRGSVVVSDYGGSNWRWYNKYRFRYQDNDWYLIGATMGSYFTGNATIDGADEEDYNLLTGDYIIKKTDENGKVKTTTGNRGKKALVKLKDFNLDNM